MVPAPLPSPDGVAIGAAPLEGVEAARSVLIPPDALAVSPRPWRSRLLLDRLRRPLRREGWVAERRYDGSLVMLRVYSSAVPCIGDSITVVRGDGGWWFRSSTGDLLAPCSHVDLAASEVSALLGPWVAAACSSPGSDGP
ncbi:Uncharacterised protein [Mycobacterium tuberculosis]|nr:Uncharacterised protein [Mycobacterium tuberculosis]